MDDDGGTAGHHVAVGWHNGTMPRSNRPRRSPKGRRSKYPQEPAELDLERARSGFARRENAPDGAWMVRPIRPSNAVKEYVCPGCGQLIQPGLAHLVVWQEDSLLGKEAAVIDRRHWHSRCWQSRTYRYR